jgi:hypothetical protein
MKRTRLYAITATYTSPSIVLHHTIFPAMECSCWTGGDAGRILAVKTGSRNGTEVRLWKYPFRVTPHPAQLHTRWRIILQLTGHFTRMASDTFFRVKKDQTFHKMQNNIFTKNPFGETNG